MNDLLKEVANRGDAQALSGHAKAGPMGGLLAATEPACVLEDLADRQPLWTNHLVFFILILCWFPFRVYASCYQRSIFFEEGFTYITSFTAFWTLGLLAIVVFLPFVLLLRWGKSVLITLTGVQITVGAIVALVMQV